MSLYTIIKSLQSASGSNAKSAILEQNKDNELLKEFMRCVNSPAINFYQKKIAKHHYEGEHHEFSADTLSGMLYHLAERNITGRQAERWLGDLFAAGTEDCKMLIKCVIDKSVGAGVGDTMILKVWPELYFIPPYQRCSLMDDKIKAKFEKLPEFYVQPKLDGSYLALVTASGEPPKAITRAGSYYPAWFSLRLSKGLPDGFVGLGEVEVFKGINLLPRQEGNGLLNSVLKGADEDEFYSYTFKLTCWDMLTPEEFKEGQSKRPYKERLTLLFWAYDNHEPTNVEVIKNKAVSTLAQAYSIYSDFTTSGMEGAVIKTKESTWRDGTSKDNVKLKIAFEAEYVITKVYEGEKKYVGMLGGFEIETSDGKLQCSVGTGFTDQMRKDYWNLGEALIGTVATVIANDVITSRGSYTASLFLPVFSELRLDKTEADSFERVMEQLASAKGLK